MRASMPPLWRRHGGRAEPPFLFTSTAERRNADLFWAELFGAARVRWPAPVEDDFPEDWPTLTSLTAEVVERIAASRARVRIRSEIRPTGNSKGYTAGGNARIRPTAICTPEEERNPRLKALIERLYVEVGGEGAANAVMTGDSAGFTWGSGLAHNPKGGFLELWVNEFFAASPQAKAALLDLGITLEGNTWKVVHTASGTVRVGEQAIALINGAEPAETKKLLLSIFMNVAEQFGTEAANAQWSVTKKRFFYDAKTGPPREVIDDATAWDPKAVCYVIHCAMWGTFAGWHRFKKTGGDSKKILRLEVDYTRYYENRGTYILVPSKLGEREIFPSITMLRNLGAGYMITDRFVEPLDALADARKGDVVFQMNRTATPGLYVLRGVPPVYDPEREMMDEIIAVQAYSMAALLAHFGRIRDQGGKNKGYQRLKAMRDYYASDRNPRKESFGLRPRIAMDAVLHRAEGEASRWILDDGQRASLPGDQVQLIKKTVGLA